MCGAVAFFLCFAAGLQVRLGMAKLQSAWHPVLAKLTNRQCGGGPSTCTCACI